MADKLLIRMFNVGLGDFIYCQIPGGHTDGSNFHVVIDCGTLSGEGYLKDAVPLMKQLLPEEDGKKRLDLLIVTHKHKDHMAGFGLPLWDDVAIKAIWMSAAMKPGNPQAKRANKLHELAGQALTQAAALNLGPEFDALFGAYAADNDTAVRNLTKNLPAANGIEPVYVHAGQSTDGDLKLPLKEATFHILGPEEDIDHWYLGKPEDSSISKLVQLADDGKIESFISAPRRTEALPGNVAVIDFRNLQSRMLSSALAFSEGDGALVNNTSVVLLIEWNGKRLLFVGDAEWQAKFKEGKGNSSWNTIWHRQPALINKPVDFLKVGHHGSINATPWGEGIERDPSSPYEPLEILNAILPQGSKAQAAASTERGRYKTIPEAKLLADLGGRIGNSKKYSPAFRAAGVKPETIKLYEEYEEQSFSSAQPPRTDFEKLTAHAAWVDILI
ncbi:beta-lactamase superfamily II metal-dependent hydrolase [Rhizobium mongolense]|uniref:Beta-lactamase superfamily II metal-dependent hydrolase n=2 Tax=Rhizobium mongolense TaxID=57676 RepID=A0A7W6RSR0_9HYPH|nr:beta-lactamase superfamily II metal-dependent hydrolase [Rhizobium mongolense]